jgi:hypothetical protein
MRNSTLGRRPGLGIACVTPWCFFALGEKKTLPPIFCAAGARRPWRPPVMTTANSSPPKNQRSSAEPIVLERDDRRYRVLGLEKNLSAARLTVNVKVERGETMHVDRIDLYSDRQRRQFVRRASEELYVDERILKSDLAQLLGTLEQRQTARGAAPVADEASAEPTLTAAERAAAEALLADPQLIPRIGEAFDAAGLAGEEANRLACYLACTSRLLARPLGVLVQSSSSAGKTTLLDATLRLMPTEAQVRLSAMTGQSLYYLGQDALKHKILAIAEDEGVAQASYALKLLQSEGRLTLAAAEKDGELGRQTTRVYEVEGPCALLLTTTAELPDAELANRCLVLHVNESAEQTAAIHARQRAAYAALPGEDRRAAVEALLHLHQNAQRLLQPLAVHIPWAEELSFRSDRLPMRRAHAQYLTLIAASAVLHQRQRKTGTRPAWRMSSPRRPTPSWLAGWPGRCLAARSKSCCRRPGGCWCCWTTTCRPRPSGSGSRVRVFVLPSARSGLRWATATANCAANSLGWSNWSTCSPSAPGRATDASTRCSTTAKAARGRRSCWGSPTRTTWQRGEPAVLRTETAPIRRALGTHSAPFRHPQKRAQRLSSS